MNAALYAALAVLFTSCGALVRETPVDHSPPAGPEATCAKACADRAKNCGRAQCARGCNLILDRLAEHEGAGIVACVARAGGTCDERAWAHCAAWVGVHADGGPPAPPPPSDDVEE
jgi:hypothetical protein